MRAEMSLDSDSGPWRSGPSRRPSAPQAAAAISKEENAMWTDPNGTTPSIIRIDQHAA
jgi:hypothetical protein